MGNASTVGQVVAELETLAISPEDLRQIGDFATEPVRVSTYQVGPKSYKAHAEYLVRASGAYYVWRSVSAYAATPALAESCLLAEVQRGARRAA